MNKRQYGRCIVEFPVYNLGVGGCNIVMDRR